MELYDKRFSYIQKEKDIIPSFKDDGYELFENNTTDCQERATCIIKLKDKERYFEVTVNVSLVGHKQDVGDKLYTIESIDEITYKEIPYLTLISNYNKNIEMNIMKLEKRIEKLKKSKLKK